MRFPWLRKRHSRVWILAVPIILVGVAGACRPRVSNESIERFRQTCGRLAAEAEARDSTTVEGREGWLFFAPELRHVSVGNFWGDRAGEVSRARRTDAADPLPAILDFKHQLDEMGVELLVVPVPAKSFIYPDQIAESLEVPLPVPRLDAAHQSFYRALRKSGVDTLDLTQAFLDGRFGSEGPLYCRQDTHWSGVGCVVAAQLIAAVVRQRPWYQNPAAPAFAAHWYTSTIDGDLSRDLPDLPVALEELQLRRVVMTGDSVRSGVVPPDPESQIVLLGDSHNLVFQAGGDMHATGSGLADQLAYELGVPVDLVAVRGSGATSARVNLLRRAQRDSRYWANKRLVIWCFSAREFTEGDGWSLVPITPTPAP